jgi:hypothetical protein
MIRSRGIVGPLLASCRTARTCLAFCRHARPPNPAANGPNSSYAALERLAPAGFNCREVSELAIASTRRRLKADDRFTTWYSHGRRRPARSKRHACNRQSGHRRRNAVAIPAVAAQGLATRVVASPAFRAPGGEQKSCHPRRDAWFSSRAQETLVFALSRRDERGQPWPPIVAAGARHLVRSIRERGVGRSSCCRSGRPSPAAYLLGA